MVLLLIFIYWIEGKSAYDDLLSQLYIGPCRTL